MFLEFTMNEAMWVLGSRPLTSRYSLNVKVTGISTDTRRIKPGDLFVALRGENFDGHDYVIEAIRNGAVGIIADKEEKVKDAKIPILIVEDTQYAYGELAKWYLRGFDVQRIALTGSAGKTTTREMITAILEKKGKVLRNEGNENNLIGVPKTIFKLDEHHKYIVLELGTNQPGEIQALTDIAQPDCSILLNALPVHLEGLGSYRGVMEEKAAILNDLTEDEVAIVNYDDLGARHGSIKCKARVISFGRSSRFEIFATEIKYGIDKIEFKLNDKYPFEVPIFGVHNITNILAAISVGWWAGVDVTEMQQALKEFESVKQRNEIMKVRDAVVINDCYNANPASMIAAISMLSNTPGSRKIAVIGDMLELGEYADFYHKQVANTLAKSNIDYVIAVGRLSKQIHDELQARNINSFFAVDADEATMILENIIQPLDLVLIKASRSMQFEKIYKSLKSGDSTRHAKTA